MKTLTKKLTFVSIACICCNLSAQIPGFTKIDAGAIYESKGAPANASNMLFDVDNDGDLDPIICNMNAIKSPIIPMKLYENEREGFYVQKQFISDRQNDFTVENHGPMADLDNDGDIDFISQRFKNRDYGIFINDGFGSFEFNSIIRIKKVASSFTMPSPPVVLDFNRDGFLDIISFDYIIEVHYNDGKGKFYDKETIGSFNEPVSSKWLHSITMGDADNDGDMDFYCGMSLGSNTNAFFINQGDSLEQVDASHITQLDEAWLTTSVNWIDGDNDGDLDLFITNLSPGEDGILPVLYENLGNLEFEMNAIIDEEYQGSFTISDYWGDLDNDGDHDLFISLEDGPFPFPGPYKGTFSPTKHTILYENNGDGTFTNIKNNGLTSSEAHTAKIFDQDNDGDLDVLTVGNAYDSLGHNHLFINGGNSNSFISISCIDKYSCATPYGTRVCVKTEINGKNISQTLEINLVDGNVSYEHSPLHFGLGDASIVDSIIIRWPSAHIDTFLNIAPNQFYHAVEDSILEIDFRATNYIQYLPGIPAIEFFKPDTSTTIDLQQHFKLMTGDTVPEITGDTILYKISSIENEDLITASLDGSLLSIESDSLLGTSKINVIASTNFSSRKETIVIKNKDGIPPEIFLDITYLPDSVFVQSTEDGTIYLVPEGTDSRPVAIKFFSILSMSVIANSPVTILLDTIESGVYWLYAADSIENISEPAVLSTNHDIAIEENEKPKIYPNPANAFIIIESDRYVEYCLDIRNINGQLVMGEKYNGPKTEIDISSLPKGFYFITIKSRELMATEKLIKL